MRLESEIRDGVGVLHLQGRFVTGSDRELETARQYLEKMGIAKAVVDLTAVPYIDSTGLAFVVELYKSLSGRGGKLTLAHGNARVREVLEMTRIREIIPMFDGVEAAEAALHEHGAPVC